jgi:hypothetical protein
VVPSRTPCFPLKRTWSVGSASLPSTNRADTGRYSYIIGSPLPLPERLAVTNATLDDRVGEILRFCRSAARHTVRPAGRFPLAGRGGASA